ncbi:uncharacterized protein OCT59_011528 [Rhizophagus irregularis]|uniref:Attractin/MKLN-like beta-propeller domain-containing protein n=3 Tax=Rhizophagus irregularis TaxID=588596 RepID=A0A015LF34_RHIIW|nr:hypothetical protein GLOIN_2v1876576 [Rhizophagus irregularis DAOM 181602=DAOM 197198]EXX53453.1 hypothetical protein RirG_243780 [Rhizophagus irregularis DAOM 197198w]UZO00394.1 hypothetical protein OCT59_011528 [Rhizophagus irregularis]POG70659.1 hypothetical protein GLOIN_2v1876576 [Rhizophagus irregularis DAOM 181602=DAOM 197198]CAG8684580.1 673_t:CDS:2 [Rhizophagus irregularis]GBC39040.1 hypothetical protein GLOIN_2v1876576 [Rhizophagus irregularis DAOM 181602=DAOM 197198]|eukprot:XP_025177525.1 hypothetical protein GLOIN_2v1876576 [Rhizophagus irregularis DAOM 181602=DAOM 197198]
MLFFFLIVICLCLNEFTLAFTPNNTVWGHSAVFANSRIYITGGIFPIIKDKFEPSTPSREFYYLDVEKPFRVRAGDKLPWVDLSSVSQNLPAHAWSAFSNCGLDNSLYLYIGEPDDASQTVCDVRTGKMYRFGGINPVLQPDNNNNNMDILNTLTLAWEHVNTEGRYDHTGTMLPNGYIVYIGGKLPNGEYADMTELLLYNTNNDTWISQKATDYSPTPRAYHSAVLTQDGRIIVYGGYTGDFRIVSDDLVILDTYDYTWSNAKAIDPPPVRFFHTATLVGYYMIVAFGRTNNDLPLPTSNEVFILNTYDKSNYKWVNEFNPDLSDLPYPSDQNSYKNLKTQNSHLTIGIIILSIVLALIGVSFLIYFYRKRRLSRPDMLVPSSQEAN